ncbi:MAG: PQQ-binding-like beta-propeller repeat protein [Mariniphaga sp.]|nr:PQQ-binding-like beta-propeller repeat protein [Mariniphaga sp.]
MISKKQSLSEKSTPLTPIRLWPGVAILLLQWFVRFGIPIIIPGAFSFGVLGGVAGGLVIVVWWAFFSRAPGIERWSAILLMIIGLVATSQIIDVSIATAGRGMFFTIYAIPVLSLAFIIWAVVSRRFSVKLRRITMVLTILIACGVWTVLRIDGITGDEGANFSWRWAETSEERLLAQEKNKTATPITTINASEKETNWLGFRGSNRDGIVNGVQIETDWSNSPPLELWRHPIGPGCSSFAVRGDLIYTQEQRGNDEIVSCYNLTTGEPVWQHRDAARFYDSHAGAGPRSTPTISGENICTLGATGILNLLNAGDGTLIWSQNIAIDNETKHSGWGITSSPLIVDSVVIIAAVGKLVSYDLATGDPRWFGNDGGDSYSSPHLKIIDGKRQILLMSGNGIISIEPISGKQIWEYKYPCESRILQPAFISDNDIMVNAGGKKGIRRISVTHESDQWKIEELWTSTRMRPDFNDFVVHKGHVFGFDGPSLACIDIDKGERKWKGGRYGGQLILLADQDLLLVLSEKGELVLVEANPNKYSELAHLRAIEGRTWNHPVLVGDILLVRNTSEMVAYKLALRES